MQNKYAEYVQKNSKKYVEYVQKYVKKYVKYVKYANKYAK